MDSTIYIYIIGALAIVGSLWLLLRKKRTSGEEAPVLQEVDTLAAPNPVAPLALEEEIYAPTAHTEEAPIDLSKIQNVDSDKPFANLKSNSIGTAEQGPIVEPAKTSKKKSTKKNSTKKTSEKKSMKASSGTSADQPKKRTYRKKGTQA
jgi:LPXTG-motif cell wall-anchored protein